MLAVPYLDRATPRVELSARMATEGESRMSTCSSCGHTERDVIHASMTVIAGAGAHDKPNIVIPPMCEFMRSVDLTITEAGRDD